MNRRTLGCLFELLETFLLVLVIFLVIELFVAQPYQVQQTSMESSLMPGQFVLIDKLTPRFDGFHHGDIVVFNTPPDWTGDPSGTPYVKRIVGVGGDFVDIHGGHLFINGSQATEAYLTPGQTTDMPNKGSKTWKLGRDELFVLGDNRADSVDSRSFGPVAKSFVVGRAWLRYWPIGQFGLLTKQPPAASVSPAASGSPAPSKTP